jgi:putative ABC transport system substrate-binding protein
MKRIAIVGTATKIADMRVGGAAIFRVFFEELARDGFVEGQNLGVDRYSGEGRTERYADIAREVINTHPDLIFVPGGIPMALHFKSMTTTIPIVSASGDPIAMGLVSSLARPGGNVTGVSVDGDYKFYGKRLELLLEAIPKVSKIGVLASQRSWKMSTGSAQVVREAAKRAGVSVTGILLGTDINEAAYRRALNSIEQYRLDGLVVSQEAEHYTYRATLIELVAKSRIPAIYPYREFVDDGGLMSYSADLPELFRHMASQIAEILKGANPEEIPIYQATNFELAINLKTARALGLELPATLVATADEVID